MSGGNDTAEGHRMGDVEPDVAIGRLDERVGDTERRLGQHDKMFEKLQNRQPPGYVFYQNGLTGLVTALATAIYFLLRWVIPNV